MILGPQIDLHAIFIYDLDDRDYGNLPGGTRAGCDFQQLANHYVIRGFPACSVHWRKHSVGADDDERDALRCRVMSGEELSLLFFENCLYFFFKVGFLLSFFWFDET